MKIDLNSKLFPNVQIYVRNGHWSGVIVEDCMTGELLFHIFGQGPTKSTTRRIDRNQTFNDMFPGYDLSFSKPSLKISSLPFTFGAYASDGKSIYQIVYKDLADNAVHIRYQLEEGLYFSLCQPLPIHASVRSAVTIDDQFVISYEELYEAIAKTKQQLDYASERYVKMSLVERGES